ncbi:MAG: Hsp70 family protein [Acidobacteriota bacterium]
MAESSNAGTVPEASGETFSSGPSPRTIGIDFGTTSSVVATSDGAALRVFRNVDGHTETPSVIALRRGGDADSDLSVGRRALASRHADPQSFVASVKRRLGTSQPIVLGNREHTAEELAARMLGRLMEDAEREMGEEVSAAVIAVPACFGQPQRKALKEAALAAGVPLAGLIDEPVAVALAYGARARPSTERQTLLVYDFGGGKFEASVVLRADDFFVVSATAGDRWLGGDDLDGLVYNCLRARLAERGDTIVDGVGVARLRHLAREARERLSRESAVNLVERDVARTADGEPLDLDTRLSRAELEDVIRPSVERSVALTREAVAAAGLTPDDVDHLLLVGGVSQTPLVSRLLGVVFNLESVGPPSHPKHDVASGAAIHAAWHTAASQGQPTPWTGPTAGYDVLTDAGRHTLIPPNQVTSADQPFERTFLVTAKGQAQIRVPLVQTGSVRSDTDEPEASLAISLPPTQNAATPVRLQTWMDADGILHARARLVEGDGELACAIETPESGLPAAAVEVVPDSLDRAELTGARATPARHGERMDDLGGQDELWQRAEALVDFKKFVVSQYRWALDAATGQRLDELAAPVEHALDVGLVDHELADKVSAFERGMYDQLPDLVRFLLGMRGTLQQLQGPSGPGRLASNVAALQADLDSVERALQAGSPTALQDLARLEATLSRVAAAIPERRTLEAGFALGGSPGAGDHDFVAGLAPDVTAKELHRLGEAAHHLSSDLSGRLGGAVQAASDRSRRRPHMPAALSDRVHFGVSAPPNVTPAAAFLIDVYAFLEHRRAEVVDLARRAARGTEILFREKGPVRLARGTTLTVHLRLEGLIVDDPEDRMLWEADIGSASFPVRVPEDATPGDRPGLVTFYVDGLQVAKLHFTIAVGPVRSEVSSIDVREERHRRAFASYARKDTDQVLDILSGMQKAAAGLDVFFDRASIRSGEIWEDRLEAEVVSRDVFYLFWSAAASASTWVDREWRLALERRGLRYIDPVPLVSPEIVPPPSELARLNFDDWVLAYKRRSGPPPRS